MKGELKNIGKFTKWDSIKLERKISREIELENSTGKTKHKLCYV